MQHLPLELPTAFLVVTSPSSKISNPPHTSFLCPSFVPPSSSAMMGKIKY
jgi:hypothetical protein